MERHSAMLPHYVLALLLALAVAGCAPARQTPTPVAPPATSVVPPEFIPGATPAPMPSPPLPKPAPAPSPKPGLAASPPPASPAASPAVAPRLQRAVTANQGDHTLSVVDLAAGRLAGTISLDRAPHAIALSPDGRLAFVTDASQGSQAVVVADIVAMRQMGEVTVGSQPADIVVSPRTGQAVVANSGDNSISVFDASRAAGDTLQAATSIQVGQTPRGVDVADVEGVSRAVVANEGDGTVSIVDLQGQQVMETIQVGGRPGAVAVGPDGSTAFVLRHDPDRQDSVVVLDLRANQSVSEIEVARDLTDVAPGPDGRSVYVSATEPNRNLYRIDLATRRVTDRFGPAGGAGAVAVVPGGAPDRVVMVTIDDKLVVFDAVAQQAALIVTVGKGPVDVAVSGTQAPSAAPSPVPPGSPVLHPTPPRAPLTPGPAASPAAGTRP